MKAEKTIAYKLRTCGYPRCSPCYVTDYEAKDIDFACEYIDRIAEAGKSSNVFVDVGAHVGLWSLQMSEWYQCRYNVIPTIYALEPDRLNHRVLRSNAQQAETGIVPVQAAAWNTNKQLYLKPHANPGRHTVTEFSLNANLLSQVQGIALDTVASTPAKRNIDVIKIDVEGAELNVLNGARQILTDNKQLLLVIEYSVGHFKAYGYTPAQLTAFLAEHDYYPARPIDERTVKSIRTGEIKRVMFIKGEIA